VCRLLRQEGNRVPILMLTARDAVSDRIDGLDAGADDYLIKPFALVELLARVRALGRRGEAAPDEHTVQVADLTLDLAAHTAQRGERTMELTARECRLLEYLLRHAGQVLTREQISAAVWGYEADLSSNVVETYIHYLRDKIDRGFARPLLRTVRGVGYTIRT
jgi:DNA-binding response OmpR family regulator